jgi:hypothetical protein
MSSSPAFAPGRCLLAHDDRVARTAAAELTTRWPGWEVVADPAPAPRPGDLVLALTGHPLVQALVRSGRTDLHDRDPARDPFHVLVLDGVGWIIGGSPRGLLNGVHLVTGAQGPVELAEGFDRRGSFALRERTFAPFFSGWTLFDDQKTTPAALRAAVRLVSRMGASQVAATNDFGPDRDLHAFVPSSIFPDAFPADRRSALAARLRLLIAAAQDFGLGVQFDSNQLACQGGPWVAEADRHAFLQRFPAEVLSPSGTYQGQVLCFGHAQVQAFYAEVIARFAAAFPEIDRLHYLTLDAGGEFCDPQACPRCRGLSKFDQRDRLARFLHDHLTRARPGMTLLNSSFQWDRERHGSGQLIARQAQLPPAVGLCLAATGDSATFERQGHARLRAARAATARAGQLCIGRDACHVFEDQAFPWGPESRFDYPLGIFAKIRRWVNLGFDGIYDVRGRQRPGDLHANSLAVRAALLAPASDAGAWVAGLATRWFGAAAGGDMLAAWRLLERAQAIRSQAYAFPSSSPLSEYVGWHFARAFPPTLAEPRFTAGIILQLCPDLGELEPALANGHTYHDGTYGDRLRAAGEAQWSGVELLDAAIAHLDAAAARPLPADIVDAAGWLGDGADASPATYLAEHRRFLVNQARFWAVMGSYMVLKGLRVHHGDDTCAFEAAAAPWQDRYVKACISLADHLDALQAAGLLTTPLPAVYAPATLRDRAAAVQAGR